MKKRVLGIAAALLTLALLLPACTVSFGDGQGRLVAGDGKVITRTAPLEGGEGGFDLRLTGFSLRLQTKGAEVDLTVDERLDRAVVLTADENIADCIRVSCEGGEIVIAVEEKVMLAPTRLKIAVGAPVRALTLGGAWNFTYDCPSVTDCALVINGAADGRLAFGALKTLRLTANGACDLTLTGTADDARFEINGASDISAFGLTTQKAAVTVNGAGDCEITAERTLDAAVNGVGTITYGGAPRVTPHIRGLGEIRHR